MSNNKFIPFTKYQDEYIRENYLKIPLKTMASNLGVNPGRIYRFLDRNNLKRPKSLTEKFKKESCFKKGNTPFNKGLKQADYMSDEGIKRSRETAFKKGNEPHNAKHNGAIVERKEKCGTIYKYIRISKGNWIGLQRYVWEKHKGNLKKDHVIVFKDGNTLNTNIENLEQISRKELMLRNSWENYPKEIIPTMLMIKELENKINKKEESNGTK